MMEKAIISPFLLLSSGQAGTCLDLFTLPERGLNSISWHRTAPPALPQNMLSLRDWWAHIQKYLLH